jgi:hypothetical protein
MDNQDPNSPGGKRSPDKIENEFSQPQRPGNQPAPDLRWIQGERRQPENATIRRWMNLGDKALRKDEDEEGNPPAPNPVKTEE